MRQFAALFEALDQTTKINAKVSALESYFSEVSDEDKLWTIALLSHKRPRRTVTTTLLRTWAAEAANLPLWLFEESYHIVGDLAESIALVLPKPSHSADMSLSEWIRTIQNLKDASEEDKRATILEAWDSLNHNERFVFNKLITGGFRIGVSQKLMTRALSRYTGIEENILAHRLMGEWTPTNTDFESLVLTERPEDLLSRPYPFYLAYALDVDYEALGDPDLWQAERKWDGIRGQVIKRGDELFVWSRGEELMTHRFPEYHILTDLLPNGTVIDGEILPFDDKPLPFQILQTRIGRKTVSKKTLANAPVVLMGYDLLEHEGKDIRERPLQYRREALEEIVQQVDHPVLRLSPIVNFTSWEALNAERENARQYLSEGIMLKHLEAPYETGRKKGRWWKWKIDPLTIDAVMIYAQQGHGRRANLFTDYTFAVWDGDRLVPFTKAYSGLTDAEFMEITKYVRSNTIERFGPVRSVTPNLVFEIAFEGIQESKRHKSGVALRFPRMHRWRKDKHPKEANTLEDLKGMLELYS